jgi:hypothetical protein
VKFRKFAVFGWKNYAESQNIPVEMSPTKSLFRLFLLGEDVAFFVDDFILPGALPDYSVRNSD